jgi:NAD(P)-dependent dehydrogenase (short-subunit alcohol dehydrogenase family)
MLLGGGRGIGMALSKTCLDAGATVVVTDVLPQPDPVFLDWQKKTPNQLHYYW